MAKKITIRATRCLVVAISLCGLFIALPAMADEGKEKKAHYNVNFSLVDNLKGFKGKRILVHLKSGRELAGLVKEVGNHFIHLEKLQGKEFFDALVRVEDISAIDARFR